MNAVDEGPERRLSDPDRQRHARQERHAERSPADQDRIRLTGLRAYGWHGVYPAERRQGQPFVVDVELEVDLAPAAASDDVADTVHYGELADRLVAIVGGQAMNLIEALAARLADECLDHPLVRAATVTVHKPQAPIPHPFADVAVTLRRCRGVAPGSS